MIQTIALEVILTSARKMKSMKMRWRNLAGGVKLCNETDVSGRRPSLVKQSSNAVTASLTLASTEASSTGTRVFG